ncbi:hypothetical protein FB45DRAFT_1060788 [Roridomyces roridus]|uniref:Uncharacterized protein n=1 Tax=Roridomyces roridus TaxID=1738132 RepID=A0AAD7FK11_9AGAR|nr:hypothetical protein FB45DRAFT_1060788 [Roridomyces roridus]
MPLALHPVLDDLPPFSNACGRGCGHIFQFTGPDLLGSISTLVSKHSRSCPARGYRLADSGIIPRPTLNDSHVHPASVSDEEERFLNARDVSPSPSPSASTSSVVTASTSASSRRATSSKKPGNLPTRSRPRPRLRTSSGATKRKSSRTENERRAELTSDPFVVPGTVTPHEVGCAGCERTIKLDKRSRYYPGLWEKHRDRCPEVQVLKRGQEQSLVLQPEVDVTNSTLHDEGDDDSMQVEESMPSRPVSSQGMVSSESEGSVPRKSYSYELHVSFPPLPCTPLLYSPTITETTMQFTLALLTSALLIAASRVLGADFTWFNGADCTGSIVASSPGVVPNECVWLTNGGSAKSISWSGVPNGVRFYESGGSHDTCTTDAVIVVGKIED